MNSASKYINGCYRPAHRSHNILHVLEASRGPDEGGELLVVQLRIKHMDCLDLWHKHVFFAVARKLRAASLRENEIGRVQQL